jgi:hypothetical protein
MSHFSSLLTMMIKTAAISNAATAIIIMFVTVNSIIFYSLLADSVIFSSSTSILNCNKYATDKAILIKAMEFPDPGPRLTNSEYIPSRSFVLLYGFSENCTVLRTA